jgi:hypothetical protein
MGRSTIGPPDVLYGRALMPRRRPTRADCDEAGRLVLGAIPDDWQTVPDGSRRPPPAARHVPR